MPAERIVTDDLPSFAARAAEWIARWLGQVIREQGHCALGLTGGTTPRAVYERLAELPGIPWPSVTIYFGDERAVPPDHPDSNFRMARESLLSRVPLAAGAVHRMQAERADLDQAAADYGALLPDSLDLLLLGMGSDGHTASLFPHAPALREVTRRVVPAQGGVPPVARLTITPPVIKAARQLVMMVAGADKAEAVARALEGPDSYEEVPGRLARTGTWILDRAAAARLSKLEP